MLLSRAKVMEPLRVALPEHLLAYRRIRLSATAFRQGGQAGRPAWTPGPRHISTDCRILARQAEDRSIDHQRVRTSTNPVGAFTAAR
jgi:hypothetical protein